MSKTNAGFLQDVDMIYQFATLAVRDIEHKTKIQNTAENNDCMNTGIVHAKRKVSPRGTTDQIPKSCSQAAEVACLFV
jgi:hypothetical protein